MLPTLCAAWTMNLREELRHLSLESGQNQPSQSGHPVGFSLSCRWRQWVIGAFQDLELPAQPVDRSLAAEPSAGIARASMSPSQSTWPVCTSFLPVLGDFSSHFHTQSGQKWREDYVCTVGHCTLKMVCNCLKFLKLHRYIWRGMCATTWM